MQLILLDCFLSYKIIQIEKKVTFLTIDFPEEGYLLVVDDYLKDRKSKINSKKKEMQIRRMCSNRNTHIFHRAVQRCDLHRRAVGDGQLRS